VGYSKPGLLHRFGSKEALHRAVLAEVTETVQDIIGHAVGGAGGQEHTRRVLELVTRKALARPGMAQMLLAAFEPSGAKPGTAAIREAGSRLVSALDQPLSGPTERLRVVLALKLIATGAMAQSSPADSALRVAPEQLVPLLVSLAEQVIGHPPGQDVVGRGLTGPG
jgi:AcrR family transcriptional regulator